MTQVRRQTSIEAHRFSRTGARGLDVATTRGRGSKLLCFRTRWKTSEANRSNLMMGDVAATVDLA